MTQTIYGGILETIKNIKVKNIIIGKQYENSKNYEAFIKEINKKRINVIQVEAEEKIKLDNNVYIDILWPDKNNIIMQNKLNNNSLVFKMNIEDLKIIFTGDIEEKAEKAILNKYKNNLDLLKADILKVAHHGSKTSTTIEFLKNVNPKISIIGVGANNKFGHPSDETLEKLKSQNCLIYRTDLNGEIVITYKEKMKIKTFNKYQEE